MGSWMIKQRLIFILLLFSVMQSCTFIKPFFVKNKKKEIRKVKKVEKKGGKLGVDTTVFTPPKKDTIKQLQLDTVAARKLIQKNHIQFQTYSCKARMHYKSESQNQGFTAFFKIKNNEIIWSEIQALSLSVARAYITPDSVKALDKFNKVGYMYSYSQLKELINLDADFISLQDIIVGNVFATQGNIYDVKQLGTSTIIKIKGADFINEITYNTPTNTVKQLHLQTIRNGTNSSVFVTYDDYQNIDGRLIPTNRTYNIQDIKGVIQLEMQLNKAEFDIPCQYIFSIPKGFKILK